MATCYCNVCEFCAFSCVCHLFTGIYLTDFYFLSSRVKFSFMGVNYAQNWFSVIYMRARVFCNNNMECLEERNQQTEWPTKHSLNQSTPQYTIINANSQKDHHDGTEPRNSSNPKRLHIFYAWQVSCVSN